MSYLWTPLKIWMHFNILVHNYSYSGQTSFYKRYRKFFLLLFEITTVKIFERLAAISWTIFSTFSSFTSFIPVCCSSLLLKFGQCSSIILLKIFQLSLSKKGLWFLQHLWYCSFSKIPLLFASLLRTFFSTYNPWSISWIYVHTYVCVYSQHTLAHTLVYVDTCLLTANYYLLANFHVQAKNI